MTQFKFFTIPANDAEDVETELKAFLRSRRVIAVDRQFYGQRAMPAGAWP